LSKVNEGTKRVKEGGGGKKGGKEMREDPPEHAVGSVREHPPVEW